MTAEIIQGGDGREYVLKHRRCRHCGLMREPLIHTAYSCDGENYSGLLCLMCRSHFTHYIPLARERVK